MKEPSGWRWLPLSAAVIVIDQITKLIVVNHIGYAERIPVLPVLDFTLTYNPGAAFSFLAAESGWQRWMFSVLAILVAAVIAFWMKRLKARSQPLLACALSLILAGALGNVIDRLRLGHVIDFVLAYWDEHMFPAFNVADSAITIGAILLVLDALLESRRAKVQSAGSGGSVKDPTAAP
ncbi:MAG: signal peptidase II [Gammaproteobacteria bacterium]